MIRVENAGYTYPKSAAPALDGFSAVFQRGEIVAVTGKNGCGKTTLTKLLVGVLRPNIGSVSIDGADTGGMDLFEIGQRAGYVFQNPDAQLFCDTVYNEIAFGLRNLGLDETQVQRETSRYLELFELSRCSGIYPGKLSLGEKQRLVLAAVLALGTDYLVLDEPTTGLDKRRQRELGEMLAKLRKERDCGVILVSHEDDFIKCYTDRELVMDS